MLIPFKQANNLKGILFCKFSRKIHQIQILLQNSTNSTITSDSPTAKLDERRLSLKSGARRGEIITYSFARKPRGVGNCPENRYHFKNSVSSLLHDIIMLKMFVIIS